MHKNNSGKASTIVILLVALLILSALAGIQFMSTATAAGYTEAMGNLGGVQFVVRFPDPWNGMLVVYCDSVAQPILDPRTSHYNGTADLLLPKGYAVAASNYGGAGGFPASKAISSTYTITKYIVDTYHITGKVFLYGAVMGGTFALLLAEKYPSLYSGALDISGSKDVFQDYAYMTTLANLTVPQIRSYLNLPPIYPDAMLQFLKIYGAGGSLAILNETGSTPTANPKAYEDVSPTYHANISIPVITIHSTGDLLVPFSQVTLYQAAVAKAGRSNLYRVCSTSPVVPGLGNSDANVIAQISIRFDELVSWSEQLQPTLRVSAFCNVTVITGWTWYFFAHSNGGFGSHSYQWYEGTTLLAGQTSMVMPVTKNTLGTFTFYCKVTDAEGKTANSNNVTLTVIG